MSSFSRITGRESLTETWRFYLDCRYSLLVYKDSIIDSLRNSLPPPAAFQNRTLIEVDEHFNDLGKELEILVSFRLLSIAEAFYRVDFIERAKKMKKDNLSRGLSQLRREKHLTRNDNESQYRKVNLDEILKVWRRESPHLKNKLDQYGFLLEFRHWVAHL